MKKPEVYLNINEKGEFNDIKQPTKKCFIPRALRIFSLALVLFFSYRLLLTTFYQNASTIFNPTCKARFPLKSQEKYEFDPKKHESLDIGLIGSMVDSSIEFKQHDGSNIIITNEVKISSEKIRSHVKVGSRISGDRYQWGVKGPSFFVDHGECASAKVIVHIPRALKEYQEIFIKAMGNTKVSTDYGNVDLKKLRVDLGYGSLSFKDNKVRHLVLDTHNGDIKIEKVKAGSIYLATGKGNIHAKDVEAFSFSANSRSGTVCGDIKASRVHSAVLNGNIHYSIRDIGPKERRYIGAKTVNGNVDINVLGPYDGNFFSAAINGETKVTTRGPGKDLNFEKNWPHLKKGFKGPNDHHSDNYVSAKTVNGKSSIHFD